MKVSARAFAMRATNQLLGDSLRRAKGEDCGANMPPDHLT